MLLNILNFGKPKILSILDNTIPDTLISFKSSWHPDIESKVFDSNIAVSNILYFPILFVNYLKLIKSEENLVLIIFK